MFPLLGVVLRHLERQELERLETHNTRGNPVERRARHQADERVAARHFTGGGLRPMALRMMPPAAWSASSAFAREAFRKCMTIAVFTTPFARFRRSRAAMRS